MDAEGTIPWKESVELSTETESNTEAVAEEQFSAGRFLWSTGAMCMDAQVSRETGRRERPYENE
ncbi:MAG: hypothetical protein GKR92_07190 [Gammaproteobacteria bacterium]|nr:MAG: hypothetical protein GKR92_07190 [Gammaproteobacteria bacterium]